MTLLPDSNAWVYLLDARSPEHRKALKVLPRLLEREELVVPSIVQVEVLHHVRRALGGDPLAAMHDWLHLDCARPALDATTVDDVLHLLGEHAAEGLGGRDAAILSHARRHGATLLTNDQALLKIASGSGIVTRPWSSLR